MYPAPFLGLTDKEMAGFFEISESTFNLWKQKHPMFSESIWRGKAVADSKVAESLYRRAIGYSHNENRIFQFKGEPVVVPYIKHYPPDTQAAALWLRNRQPKTWRDTNEWSVVVPEKPLRTPEERYARIAELDEKIKNLEAAL
jgi:hypothetical protein